MHLHPGFTRKRRWHYSLDESTSAQELAILHVFRLTFDFFPHEFAAYPRPPSSDNHRKVSYPKTQQRDQCAGCSQDHVIIWLSLKRRLYTFGHAANR